MTKKIILSIAFLAIFVVAYVSSYLTWDGNIPGYGLFPAQKVMEDPGFNETYFLVASAVAIFILIFLLFPKIFGFKSPENPYIPPPRVPLPTWFYVGLVMNLLSWLFSWGRFQWAYPIEHFTFVPLWWGFILVLDGLVYSRNNGASFLTMLPTTLKISAVVSCFMWFIYEYLNFFVIENWYYPNDKIFTNFGNIVWQAISYTTVMPVIIEMYWLLRTFGLGNRYQNGIKISLSRNTQMGIAIIAYTGIALMGRFPFELFWIVWVGIIPILAGWLGYFGTWTPFTPFKNGDWSCAILIALATLFNGFFWEMWNFGSEWFHDYAPTNPNYWKYSVPYLDKYHFFSEMPILGYFGYLFFGIAYQLMWIMIAQISGFNPDFEIKTKSTND